MRLKARSATFWLRLVGIAALLVPAQMVWAQSGGYAGDKEDLLNNYRYVIQKALYDAKHMEQPCLDCELTQAGKPDEPSRPMSPSCQAAYSDLYSKPVIDMRVVFGYLDYMNDVEDRYQAAALIEQITSPCDGSTNTCGFRAVDDDGELFEKTFRGGDGQMRTVRLTVVNSSVRDNEKLNRGEYKQAQERQTQRAEEAFFGGMQSADVLLYAGHARDGGGPDFGPPHLQEKARRTDYGWYRKNHKNWDRLKQAITSSSKPPKVFGLFACNAEAHFGKQIRSMMPNTGVALAGPKSWFPTVLGQTFSTLDSILNTRCESDFIGSLHAIKDLDGEPASPARFEGFFKGNQSGRVVSAGSGGAPTPLRPSSPPSWSGGVTPYPQALPRGGRLNPYPLPPITQLPADPNAPSFNPYSLY